MKRGGINEKPIGKRPTPPPAPPPAFTTSASQPRTRWHDPVVLGVGGAETFRQVLDPNSPVGKPTRSARPAARR